MSFLTSPRRLASALFRTSRLVSITRSPDSRKEAGPLCDIPQRWKALVHPLRGREVAIIEASWTRPATSRAAVNCAASPADYLFRQIARYASIERRKNPNHKPVMPNHNPIKPECYPEDRPRENQFDYRSSVWKAEIWRVKNKSVPVMMS